MTKDREVNKDKDALCKLFVGNLKFSTTTDDLKDFYSTFGDIVDCVVMKDPSGKSRGFGFVTYQNPESVDEAQKNRPHYISGRKTEPKRAIPRGEADKPEAQQNINKIFIGGLLEEVNEPELDDYFSKYGKISNTNVIRDSASGKKRGFAYITFEDYDTVDKIVLEKYHTIHGKTSEVRKALSKEEMRNQQKRPPPRKRYDRDEDDYGGNNMMMPGNFLGGPTGMGGGGMMDDMNMGNSNGMMGNTPFDMLANMGMMGGMMGNMMSGMGNNPMGVNPNMNSNPNNPMGGNFGGNLPNMPMGGGMGNMMGAGQGQNSMGGMMGMSNMGMSDGGMGGFNSGFANNMPSGGGYSRNTPSYPNMGGGAMRGDRRSGNGFNPRKPYNDTRNQNDRGFSGKRGGRTY